MKYVPIKKPVFFSRGQIFDADGRKVCNVPSIDKRKDCEELQKELVKIINNS